MSLFKDENPQLGAQTTERELSGFGSGNPVVNYYKPQTREILPILGIVAATAAEYVFIAPYACQVIAVRFTASTASSAGTLQLFKTPQASLPAAPPTSASGNVVALFSAAVALSATSNTAVSAAPTVASAAILAAGDQLSINLGGTLTSLAGGLLQIELAQIG